MLHTQQHTTQAISRVPMVGARLITLISSRASITSVPSPLPFTKTRVVVVIVVVVVVADAMLVAIDLPTDIAGF
jgi:hypothetical protein